MGSDIGYRYAAEQKVKKAIVPEIVELAFRLESIAEKVLEGKTPEQNQFMLKQIIEGAVSIRCHAERL